MIEHIVLLGDAYPLLKTLETDYFQLILTDPMYDWGKTKRNAYQAEFRRLAHDCMVFCPPENRWRQIANETLYWMKPVSTKNTSKRYSRFVEEIQLFHFQQELCVFNTHMHWSNYTNIQTDKVEYKSHKWRKPLSMMMRFIEIHTNKGDWVLDPFAGSGPVQEACIALGRNCLSIDIDEECVISLKEMEGRK